MLRHMYECPFKTYKSQLQNIFVQIDKCIFPSCKMYFILFLLAGHYVETYVWVSIQNIFVSIAKHMFPNWQMYFSKLLNVFRSPPPSWSSCWDICTSVQSKYARLGTDLWCAWPVNPQYPTPICHCNRHHHHFARWSSLTWPFSVSVYLVTISSFFCALGLRDIIQI